jgi:hypothetical protein
MATLIMIPRIIRGNLFFQVVDILFTSRAAAMCAASAVLEREPVQS